MLDARGLAALVMVTPKFEGLAAASMIAYDGPASGVLVVHEDIDTIDGPELDAETERIARIVMHDGFTPR